MTGAPFTDDDVERRVAEAEWGCTGKHLAPSQLVRDLIDTFRFPTP